MFKRKNKQFSPQSIQAKKRLFDALLIVMGIICIAIGIGYFSRYFFHPVTMVAPFIAGMDAVLVGACIFLARYFGREAIRYWDALAKLLLLKWAIESKNEALIAEAMRQAVEFVDEQFKDKKPQTEGGIS